MEKAEFTNAGLQLLLQDLYALPDAGLQQQALEIEHNFAGWLKAHFILDTNQQHYLDNMGGVFMSSAALRTSFFVKNRLPVTLLKDATPAGRPRAEDRGKLVTFRQTASGSYSQELGWNSADELSFSIEYLEPDND